MPRPTKLTPERQARACDAVRLGATYEMAAQYAGVGYSTWARWMQLAGDGRAPYREFQEAIKEAEAAAVVGWLTLIQRAAADGEWTAAAWKLERRYPETYGRRVQETTTSGTVRVEVVYVDEAIGPAAELRALPAPDERSA